MTTALPTEDRPIQLDPELSSKVEEMLKPYSGRKLEAARAAVLKVYKSGFAGSFGAILGKYETAIEEAVGD